MAARTRKIFHDQDTRARIKAAAIIKRLQDYALGSDPDAMSRSQVSAAVTLLNKVLPNLGSVDLHPEPTKTYVLRTPPVSSSMDEWLRDFAPQRPGISSVTNSQLPPPPCTVDEERGT